MATPETAASPDTNRTAELGWVLAALERGERTVAIVGLPGAGKTWLMARIAGALQHALTQGFRPDEVELVDRPVDLHELPDDRLLVFTSRCRPIFDCALVELASLCVEDTPSSPAPHLLAQLIAHRAPHVVTTTPEAQRHLFTIAAAADGLPSALVLAAEAARLMALSTLAERAQAVPEQLFKPAVAALADGLTTLTPPEHTALMRLSACPHGTRTVTAETLIADLVDNTVQSRLNGPLGLLANLRDRHLLVQHDDRLNIPRLVVAALHTTGEAPLREVALRLARLAENTSHDAVRRGRSEPLAWIGAERDNLLSALHTLVGTPHAWPLLSALLIEQWRGTAGLDHIHRHTLQQLLDRMLATVTTLDTPLSEGIVEALFMAARTAFDTREFDRLTHIETLLRTLSPQAFYTSWVRVAASRVGNRPTLFDDLRACLETAAVSADPLFEGLANLFASATFDPSSDQAQQRAETALKHFEVCGNEWGRTTALANLGFFATLRGDIEATRHCLREAIELAQNGSDKKGLAIALGNLGMLELEQGSLHLARDLLHRSHDNHLVMFRPDFMAACRNGLARVVIEETSHGLTPEVARALDRQRAALIDIERHLGDADRRVQHFESALVRAELAVARADTVAALGILDEALGLPEAAERPQDTLLLNARRAVLAPETSALHRAAAEDLLRKTKVGTQSTAASIYRAAWCNESEWGTLATRLGPLVRVPLARLPPHGLEPAWHNSSLVRTAWRTTWPLLTEARRQDLEAEARDPAHLHLVAALSTGRFRMPRNPFSDVSRRPLLVQLLTLLVTGRERGLMLDEPFLGSALWPGERMLDDARANRIQNAVSLLRKAGLKDHLERVGEAYRISPSLPLITVTGALDLIR